MRFNIALLIFIVLFGFYSQANAQQTLEANVSKDCVLGNAPEEYININDYPAIDPDLIETQLVKNGDIKPVNRRIIFYSDGQYEVKIFQEGLFEKNFHYNSSGKLYAVGIEGWPKTAKTTKEYLEMERNLSSAQPVKEYNYSADTGKLGWTGVYTGKDESWSYSSDGEVQYWKGGKAVTQDGSLIVTYEIKEPEGLWLSSY